MANNYIEEFFVSIGLDTNKVKKEAKEVGNILDNLGNKQTKNFENNQKKQVRANKTRLAEMLKDEEKAQKAHNRMQAKANAVRRTVSYQNLASAGKLGDTDKRINELVKRRDVEGLKDLNMELRRHSKALNKASRETAKLNTIQRGLNDSTRNMVRQYASVFAILGGTVAIKRIGQDFQGMDAAMLASSGSAEAAAEDMEFLDNLVTEMGLNLKDTTDAFVKFKFAAKGKISQGEQEDLFTSLSMFGTSLKVGNEDLKRAQRALSQIMSKGVVMSEELKGQLGDALPGSVQIFSRALNVTEAELFKLMEQGKLLSAEVLPKVAKEFRSAAMEGGAYQRALNGLRVTEGQFITQVQKSGNIIFKSGFEKGLANLYKTLQRILKDSVPQLEKMGRIFKEVFDTISYGMELIAPVVRTVVDNFEYLFGAVMLGKLKTFAAALNVAFLPFTAALFALEEIVSLMNDKVVGALEAKMGSQFNFTTLSSSGLRKNKEGKFVRDNTIQEALGREVGLIEGMSRVLENKVMRPLLGQEPINYSALQPSQSNSTASTSTVNQTNNITVSSTYEAAVMSSQFAAQAK